MAFETCRALACLSGGASTSNCKVRGRRAMKLPSLGEKAGDRNVLVLAETLNQAIGQYLANNKSPSRVVNELDNRGSHFYLALYWAQALALQTTSQELREQFSDFAGQLANNEATIIGELNAAQGRAMDLGGYYLPDTDKANQAMRPSATLNAALNDLPQGR